MDLGALIEAYGYWALAAFCFLEGETALLLAGLAARRGHLALGWVVLIAAVAGWAGDQCFFWIGRRVGRDALARAPALARPAQRLRRLVERHHEWVIVLVRFAYGLRIAGPVLIGATRVAAWRFALFNALGAVLWAVLVATAGWAFGAATERLLGPSRHLDLWLSGALLVLVAGAAMLRAVAAWRRRGTDRH